MRSLNLDQLRAFVEVVERGSFTAAAKELNLTQPAVTHQLQELERRVRDGPAERVWARARLSGGGGGRIGEAPHLLAARSRAAVGQPPGVARWCGAGEPGARD